MINFLITTWGIYSLYAQFKASSIYLLAAARPLSGISKGFKILLRLS